MKLLLLLPVALCTLWALLGLGAVLLAKRRPSGGQNRPRATDDLEPVTPVTVLKPLCGCDPDLYGNLETFFCQDHQELELLFGVEDPSDPAIAVVESLQARYPAVRSRLVVTAGGRALNPKVRNLMGMLPHAAHDLTLVSDSNVRAPAHYVRELLRCFHSRERVGLVTNLFAGSGERSLGAALESVQLNGFCAAGAALPTLLGDTLVIGKSMLFSRSVFAGLGGFERVADVLAEDYLIGKLYQHAGYRVLMAPTVLRSHVGRMSLAAFLRRHLRWAMLRWRLRPAAALLEALTGPLAVLPFALGAWGPAGLFWAFGVALLRDLGGWLAVRGPGRCWLPVLLGPLRELLILAVWALAPLKRHVAWRGHRLLLAMGTLLFEDDAGARRSFLSAVVAGP